LYERWAIFTYSKESCSLWSAWLPSRASAPWPRHSQAAACGEALVVAHALAVGLVILAEVAPAALVALQRVAAHQLAQLEEVRDAAPPSRGRG
jgi:hypothetical protein